MAEPPIHDPRILEALEACRPASDDIADPAMERLAAEMAASPELDDLYERLQRLDAAVAGAFQDVPVPEGLAERILARLARPSDAPIEEPARAIPAVPSVSATGVAAESAPKAKAQGRIPRYWAIALAASLLVGVALWHVFATSSPAYTAEELAFEAINRETALGAPPAPPADPDLVLDCQSKALPWQSLRFEAHGLSDFLEQSGVVFDIAGPAGIRAKLYVVPLVVAGVGSAPPPAPTLNTAGLSAAVWQEGNLAFILVVVGDAAEYQQIISPPATGSTLI